MKGRTFFSTLLVLVMLSTLLMPYAVAQGPNAAESEKPTAPAPAEVFEVSLDASGATQSGIENVGSSTLANVTPAELPIGTPFDMCFTVFVQSPDAEYMDHFDVDLPDGWTVNSVAPDSVPPANGCSGALPPVVGVGAGNVVYWQSTGYPPQTGCGAWNGGSTGTNFDFCTNITIPDTGGAPWTLPWNYIGDGWGADPHQVSGSYGPIGPVSPIMLTPPEINAVGCACELQEHEITVWNNTGADTNVNLSYSIVSGNGSCSGPAQVFVPDGASLPITVELNPTGSPGDVVVCEVYAEDAAVPAHNDVSYINKTLVDGYYDPAGWQLEPITGATGNQWAGGVVGTNPAAAGPVGYVVGGLGVGSSAPNPDLQMYDPGTGTWTQLTDMPNWRFSPVVGWIGDLLYAAGGYDATFVATNDLQVYDPATNTWDNTTYADMPNIRGGGAGGVGVCASGAGPCLFHVGGGPDGSFANTTLETWQYDPSADAWTQLDNKPAGSSPDGHILGAGVSCLGQIYVGGDYRGFHEFFRLDATQPSGSQWTQLANIPAAAGAMTPAFVCKEDWGKIVLIGGDPDGSWGTYNTTVYVYDIATDTWDGPLPQTLNVGQLGSVGWHMYDRVWTAGGTVGSGAITPMPFESLLQITCEPCAPFEAWKEAPATAEPGEVISYTIVIEADPLMNGMYMVDPLPAGVEYAGNLTYTMGYAWYSPTVNTVFWEYAVKNDGVPAAPRPTVYDPASAVDLVGGFEPAAPAAEGTGPTWAYPDAVLWDNGPLVTHPGDCSGMDASRLQTDLGMNTLGFGHQLSVGNRMADDFEITDPAGWQIDQITFFAYQTNAPVSPSPITGVYYQIWDGPPNDPGSSVIWGDLITNRLLSSASPNMQRDSGTAPCANNRYIFADVASAGLWLPPGVYWLDWMTDGSLSSGPWAPPVTILGQTTTGNALQYTTSSGAWGPANDSGTLTQQDMPFIIEGPSGPEMVEITFDVLVTGDCGDVILNEGWAGIGGNDVVFAAETEVTSDPAIAVEPPELLAGLCPDAIQVLGLEICNEGCLPLEWEIHEMTPTLPLAGSPFTPVDVTGQGINPGLTTASPQVQPAAVPASPEDVLWDQPLSAVNQNAYVDQEFPDAADYSSFLADDFVNADPWQIESIFVPGDGWNGFSSILNATALTWQIYADNAGVPDGDPSGGGNPPVWTLTLPPTDPQVVVTPGTPGGYPSDVQLNLATPGQLPPGHWWLVFYPTMTFGSFGQYGRQPADTTNGYTGQFINPGGGFGYGTAWQDWTVLGGQPPDIAFRIEGEVVGIVYPDFPWISEDPISGTVPAGECQMVDVTFDSTGLEPGDQLFADLVILSNDPDTPEVLVPTTMTVWEPVAIETVTYTVEGCSVSFDSTVVGEPPYAYTWDFGDDVDTLVRVGHASPDAPAVDVLVDGAIVLSNVPFGAVSNYLPVPAGEHLVQVVPAGAPGPAVISATLTLAAGTDYSVVAIDVLANITPLVMVDDNSAPAPGNAHVKFVHASPDAPAVDIAVAGGPVLFPNVSFGEAQGPLPVPAGTYDLEVRLAGTSTVVLPLPGVQLKSGIVYTVFAMGFAAGGPPPLQAVAAIYTMDPDPVYTYPAPGGTFTVTLMVENACGEDMWEDVLTVSCEPPTRFYYLPIIVKNYD